MGAWLSGVVLVMGLLTTLGSGIAEAQVPASQIGAVSTPNPTDSSGNTITPPTSTDNSGVSPGSGTGTGTNAASTGSGGSLASTGADILVGLLAAALLILLGTSLTLAARQRRETA